METHFARRADQVVREHGRAFRVETVAFHRVAQIVVVRQVRRHGGQAVVQHDLHAVAGVHTQHQRLDRNTGQQFAGGIEVTRHHVHHRGRVVQRADLVDRDALRMACHRGCALIEDQRAVTRQRATRVQGFDARTRHCFSIGRAGAQHREARGCDGHAGDARQREVGGHRGDVEGLGRRTERADAFVAGLERSTVERLHRAHIVRQGEQVGAFGVVVAHDAPVAVPDAVLERVHHVEVVGHAAALAEVHEHR